MQRPLTPDELLSWSKSILEEWSPVLEVDDESSHKLFTKSFCDELRFFFINVELTSFSRALVRDTRIHLALEKIADLGGGWPEPFVDRAGQVLDKIKQDTGGIDGLAGGLWDEGGSMEGCQEVMREDGRRGYLIELKVGQTVRKAFETGDMGFRVGDWWLSTAAALRAGIISSIEDFITTDGLIAYAVVMSGDLERPGATANETVLYATEGASRQKLMRSYTEHKAVRILRTHTLRSPLAPTAGVRYDGLYMIRKWSVKLIELADGGTQNVLAATLERIADVQPELAQALRHPVPEELAEWVKFWDEKENMVKSIADVDTKRAGTVLGWLPGEDPRRDSGIAGMTLPIPRRASQPS